MSKKRTRSALGSAGTKKWEQGIVTTALSDDEWKATVVWIAGSTLDDYHHINTLASAVNAGSRKLFAQITKENLYDMVNELGNPKNKAKIKEFPTYSEICEVCGKHFEAGEEIPLTLLSKLIKFRLLDIRAKDLKRREGDKRPQTGGDKTARGKGGKGDKERAKSPGKGAKGKKTPEPPSAKGETKLRKRGEEDKDREFVDDEPDDGPSFYIFISGFHQPTLIPLLADLGVHIDAIIKVLSDDYKILHESLPPATDTDIKPDDTQGDEAARSQALVARKELRVFWRDIITQLHKEPDTSKLNDLACFEYIVQVLKMPKDPEDQEDKAEFGLALFEDVACLVYDLLDARRQWQNFITHLHLIHIPVLFGTDPKPESQWPQTPPPGAMATATHAPPGGYLDGEIDIDMRFYNTTMDTIPQESVSTQLMMHVMLDQISAWEKDKEPLPTESSPQPPKHDTMDDGLSDYITKSSFKLALSNDELSTLASEFNANITADAGPTNPQLIDYSNKLAWRLKHLKPINGFDPMKIEQDFLAHMPLTDALKLPHSSAKSQCERTARLQELLHFCSTATLSQAEADHAFMQFVFENMKQTTVTASGEIVIVENSKTTIPWDDAYPFFSGDVNNAQEPDEDNLSVTIENAVEADKLVEQLEKLDAKAPQLPPAQQPPSGHSVSSPNSRTIKSRNKKLKKIKTDVELSTPTTEPAPDTQILQETVRSSGILKSPCSRSTSRSSVHFEYDIPASDQKLSSPTPIADQSVTLDDLMATVLCGQKCNMDQWCFAEYFEPKVFSQVMRDASYTHPYMDSYLHKSDHTLFVVLHNPYNVALHSTISWQTNLHSNVGFRNYLEHVAASIDRWTQIEEAKYEGDMLAKEVEGLQKDMEPVVNDAKGGKLTDRTKTPQKRPTSRSSRCSSQTSSSGQSGASMLIRDGSLKAQKLEQEQAKLDEAEAERAKDLRGSASAKKMQKKEEVKEEEKKDKKGFRHSSKSSASKAEPEDPKPVEPLHPFRGYDVGNNMIHVGGTLTTMFPADGGQIRVNKTEFVQGTVSVNTTVLKDGHQFQVHILDPHVESEIHPDDIEEEPPTDEKTEKPNPDVPQKPRVGRFGSLSVVLNDGMSLSVSTYGPSGLYDEVTKSIHGGITGRSTPSVNVLATKDELPVKTPRKEKNKGNTPEVTQEEDPMEEEPEPEPAPIVQNFQQMFLACPDGLNISFQLESALGIRPEGDERRLTVRQHYPFKTAGHQQCESLRASAMEETSRLLTSEGVVIRYMLDSSIMLLYPDGKVTVMESLPTPEHAEHHTTQRPVSAKSNSDQPKGKSKSRNKKLQNLEMPLPDGEMKKHQWITTLPDGTRFAHTLDGTKMTMKDILVCSAMDTSSEQVLLTREDHVVRVTHPDGTTIVEHADGTRITSFIPVAGDEDKDSDDLNNASYVQVECPGYASVKFISSSTECSLSFGIGTIINADPAGRYDVYHHDGGYLQIEEDGTAVYTPKANKDLEMHKPDDDMQYVFRHFSDSIVETIDNEGNQFMVKHTGDTNVCLANVTTDIITKVEEGSTQKKSEDGNEADKKVVRTHTVHCYKQHAPRFFIVQADGSGTELLRYQDVSQYISAAEDNPETAILMDSVQDYPGVVGITIMKPYKRSFSNQWLRPYSKQTIIPVGLTTRDLISFPAREYKKPGPVFGTNVGKGLRIGGIVQPVTQKVILKCPEILEVRQLLQFRPVTEELRESLEEGLRDYGQFIMTRHGLSSSLLIQDPRSETEKLSASELAAAARSVTESNAKEMYLKTTAQTLPESCVTPPSRRSHADLDRDVRENEEVAMNRKTLRDKQVMKYFDSELGKAFMMSTAPDLNKMSKELAADTLRPPSTGQVTPEENHGSRSSTEIKSLAMVREYLRDTSRNASEITTPSPGLQGPIEDSPPEQPDNAEFISTIGAPTPKEALGGQIPSETPSSNHAPCNYPSIQEIPQEEDKSPFEVVFPGHSSAKDFLNRLDDYPVPAETHERRKNPPVIPAYISNSGRYNSEFNEKFHIVEDPVRRQVKTSSVAGANLYGAYHLANMRGFELLPMRVEMGVLKEGTTYVFPVQLKNTGVDSCRFKVKQPPPSTGMQVRYELGPVAAGMKKELMLEVYAIAAGATGDDGVGRLNHNVEIVTETDHLFLPVTAVILTEHEYEIHKKTYPNYLHSKGVCPVSNRPPAGQGIIRPHRNFKGVVKC